MLFFQGPNNNVQEKSRSPSNLSVALDECIQCQAFEFMEKTQHISFLSISTAHSGYAQEGSGSEISKRTMLEKCTVVWEINILFLCIPKEESELYTAVTGSKIKCHFIDKGNPCALEYQLPTSVKLDQRPLKTTKLFKMS